MLMGFSPRHSDGAGASSGWSLTRYFFDDVVLKYGPSGTVRLRRDPEPEILFGDAGAFRSEVRGLRYQNRYRSGVLSFAGSDILPKDFNAGDVEARAQVAQIIDLLRQTLFPGIPEPVRPHLLVGTHTHAGRLEVNFAVPQGVIGPDGRVRSWNPDPPGRSRDLRVALRDLVNLRFGFADPEDPRRRQLVMATHWRVKLQAEANRMKEAHTPDAIHVLCDELRAQTLAGEFCDRRQVMTWLDHRLRNASEFDPLSGWELLRSTSKSLTIGQRNGPETRRVRLRGAVCEAGFGWANDPNTERREELLMARQQELRTAPERYRAAWARVAAFNRSRLGRRIWPEHHFDPEEWLSGCRDSAAPPLPLKHYLVVAPPSVKKQEKMANEPRPDEPNGTSFDRAGKNVGGSDQRFASATDPDRGFGRPGRRNFEPQPSGLTEQLALIVGALKQTIAAATRRLAASVALNVIGRALTGEALAKILNAATKLENLHDPARRARADGATRRNFEADAGDPAADPADLRCTVGSGGSRRADRQTHRDAYADWGGPLDDLRSDGGSFGPASARDREADGSLRDCSASAEHRVARHTREADAASGLVRRHRLIPPEGSRAARIVALRSAILRVLPGAHPTVKPCVGGYEFRVEGCGFRVLARAVQVFDWEDERLMRRIQRALRMAIGPAGAERKTGAKMESGQAPFQVIVAAETLRPALRARLDPQQLAQVRWSTPDRLTAPDFQTKLASLIQHGRISRCTVIVGPQNAEADAVIAFFDTLSAIPEAAERLRLGRLTLKGRLDPLPLPVRQVRFFQDDPFACQRPTEPSGPPQDDEDIPHGPRCVSFKLRAGRRKRLRRKIWCSLVARDRHRTLTTDYQRADRGS